MDSNTSDVTITTSSLNINSNSSIRSETVTLPMNCTISITSKNEIILTHIYLAFLIAGNVVYVNLTSKQVRELYHQKIVILFY